MTDLGSRVDAAGAADSSVPRAWSKPEAQQLAPMGRLRQQGSTGTKLLLITLDLGAICVAMALAFALRTDLPGADPRSAVVEHLQLGVLSLPVWVVLFSHYKLYSARHVTSRLEELRRIVHAIGAGGLALSVIGFAFQLYVARGWLVISVLLALVLVLVEREIVRRVFNILRAKGRLLRPVVMIGDNVEALALCSMLEETPELGYDVVGFVSDDLPVGAVLRGRPVIGSVARAIDAVEMVGASGVVVATTSVDLDGSNTLVRELTDAGVHVELSSSLRDIAAERITVRPLGRFPMMYVAPVRRDGWRAVAKRTFDIAFAGLALLVGAVPLGLVALAIKLDSRGPVVFRQTRLGRDGQPFDVFKFRTMAVDAEARLVELLDLNEADGPLFKMKDDPRVTRVGKVLRKLSIDEIPQFWNVLRGDMSIVGPRPALASEAAEWSPALRNRLRAKPGITGMWQVSGRSDADFDNYARLDLYYVDNWSLWTDLAIVAKTVPTVVLQRGAY